MKRFALLVIFFVFLAGFVWGAEYTWTGGGADDTWENIDNWKDENNDPALNYPGEDSNDTVIINTDAAITITVPVLLESISITTGFTLNLSSGSLTVNELTVDGDMTFDGNLTVNELTVNGDMAFDGNLTVSGTWTVDLPGTFAHNSGTVNFNNGAIVNNDNTFQIVNIAAAATVTFSGNNIAAELNANTGSDVTFENNNIITEFNAAEGSTVNFANGSTQTITALNANNAALQAVSSGIAGFRWDLDGIIYPAGLPVIKDCNSTTHNHNFIDALDAIDGGNNTQVFNDNIFIWTGDYNTVWLNENNWLSKKVPALDNSLAEIIILSSAAHFPALGDDVTCLSLTIASGAAVDLGGHKLEITDADGLSNSGTIMLHGEANQVTVDGSAPYDGTPVAGTIRYYGNVSGKNQWVFGNSYTSLIVAADANMDDAADIIITVSGEFDSVINADSINVATDRNVVIGADITTVNEQIYGGNITLSGTPTLKSDNDLIEVAGEISGNIINITAAGDIKLEGNNRVVNVNLEGNGEISFRNIPWDGVTLSVINHDISAGETKIIAAGKLIVNGITGADVTLEADEIEVNSEINCHSLTMKILSLEKAAINANLTVASGSITITAIGNLDVDTGNIILDHLLNLIGSGHILFNSASAADETVSVINHASAGGTVTLHTTGKLFINGITNGGTVSVTAGNIDITGAVTGGAVTLSAENISILASVDCERLAMYASHISGAVMISAGITASGSGDCGENAAVYIMTWDFAGTGSIDLMGTGDVCIHQYNSPTYTGSVTGNRIHYHYHIPDNTHIVYRAGHSPDDGGDTLPASISGPYRYLRADDPLGANIAYSTYGSGNVYIIDIEDGIGYLANSRNLSFTTGVNGVIELIGNYYSSGSLNFYPGAGGDGVKISGDHIVLGEAFTVHGKITLNNNDIEITALEIILNEIIEGKNSLTINGPTLLYDGVSGIGKLILNDKLTLGSNVVINADYTELDKVEGGAHSLKINGHTELKDNISAIANLEIYGDVVLINDVLIAAATVESGDIDAKNKSLEINGNIISNEINITNGENLKLEGANNSATVNLEGNGEISYNSARALGVTVNVTNNDIAAGETTITAAGKLTVNGITGRVVSLGAGEIEITDDINCHSLTMNTAAAGITANASIVSDELAVTASGNINLAHDNDVPDVDITASGNITYNSISASDVTISINKTIAGGTAEITAAGKLIIDGITNGGTVNVTAQNIDLHNTIIINGSLTLNSEDNIDIYGAISGTGSLILNADTDADDAGDVNIFTAVNIGGIFNHYSGGNLNLAADITANSGIVFNKDVNSDTVTITANAGTININNNFNLNGTAAFASEVRLRSGNIEFTGVGGAGSKAIFNVMSGALSAVKITDADVQFNGNVNVYTVFVESVNVTGVTTTINADITASGSQLYESAVVMNGDRTLTSLSGDIEFTESDASDTISSNGNIILTSGNDILIGIPVSSGSIIRLAAGKDITISSPVTNASQLIVSAQNGKVSINEVITNHDGSEGEDASIYIFANEFEVTATDDDSIIPGTVSGMLCLQLIIPWKDEYDDNYVPVTNEPGVVPEGRWHQHIPIDIGAKLHIVLYHSSVYPDKTVLEILFDPNDYFYLDCDELENGDILTVGAGNHINIFNVSENNDIAPSLNYLVHGNGYIEIHGPYKSSSINLHAGTGRVILKDADITITGSFNTNGAGLVLDKTENKISAGGITLNGGILGTVAAALTLNTAGNILITGDIGTSAVRLGDITIERGNVSFNTANPVYVNSYTQEAAASLVNTNALEINAAQNVEFNGSANVTNAFVITGNAVFNAGITAGSLHVTKNAEFNAAAAVTDALIITGKAVFNTGITAGSLQVTGASEIGAAVTITTTAAAGQIYTGDVTLKGNVQFASGTEGYVELGLIHGGGHDLIISAKSAVMNGTGADSDIGELNITPLDKVSFNSSQLNAAEITVDGNSEINADIHTTYAQNFNGDVNFGSEQHTLTSTDSTITVPVTGKVSGTAGAVINASLGISMTNPANDLSGSVSLNNNQGTANGTVNFITTGTISITGENVGRQFNITALKIDAGFIKAANLTVNSVLGILLNGDNEITSAVTLNNNTGDPATDSGNVLFNNVSTGSLTLTTSNNIGNIHITAAGVIDTSGPINAPNGEIELVSSADININSSISAVQLKILAAGSTVTIAGAAEIVTESPGTHGSTASIYINADTLLLQPNGSVVNIIPGQSGMICFITASSTINGRIDPDRICDHGIGVVPNNINIVYGHNPPLNIYTNDLYHIINSSDNIGLTVTYTVDPGYHIIIIDTNNNYYAVNRTVTFMTSGTSPDDYIKFRGDQTYHQTTDSALTLNGNVIIEGNVNISNTYVIQLENTSLTIEENSSLKLVNNGSWLIGNRAVEPDSFTGVYGSLIMNNASTLTAKRFILEGDSENERFVVDKRGAQRSVLEITGNVNIGDYVDYTGDYPMLYMKMAGSGIQDITAWNFIGSLQIEQSSNTVLLSNLEIHGEVIINNPGSLDAQNHNIILKAGLTDIARYGSSAKVGRWRIENGSIDIPAFLQNAGASVTLKKINSGDTVFFEIIGNTVWQKFICLNEHSAAIRFSAYPDRHKFLEEFSVMVDDSTNPADRITVTRYTDDTGWLYTYDNTSIIPPANGLPTAYEASQYNKFWNLAVDNGNIVKLRNVRLFFSYAETSVIIDPVTDSIEAFPFYIAGAKSYFNHNWREDKAFIVYSFIEDADGNGKADRIRAQTSSVLDRNAGSFNGFDVSVAGYTIKSFEFVDDGDNDSFYILLNEDTQHFLYNGDRVTWQIKANATLKDIKGRFFGAQSGETYSSIPPRISYALTLPNHPQTVIQMSQLVGPNGSPPANINSESFSGFKSLYSITSGSFSVEELANNPPLEDAPVTNAYFTMNGFWSSENKVNVDPDYLPKYPLNWNYSAYSSNKSLAFVSPYRVLTPEMMKKLNNWNTDPIPANLVVPDDFDNGGDLITRRSTDILISRTPADANDENYFAVPVLARSAGQNITDNNTKIIYNFDGTDFLGGSAAIEMQTRILKEDIKDNLIVYWSVNIPQEYRNPKEMPSRGKSGGLWIPDITTGGKTPLYYYSPAPDKNVNASYSNSASLLFINNLTANPPFASGNKVEFVYRLNNDSDMIVARLDIPRGTAVPSDWYNRIRPFSFDIQDIRQQRGGVSVLNNVINPASGESVYIRYVLTRPGRVTIQVHTLDGSLVKSIRRNEQREAGEYTEAWDGSNNGGRYLARGIYFIRVVGPDIDEIRKVMVIR